MMLVVTVGGRMGPGRRANLGCGRGREVVGCRGEPITSNRACATTTNRFVRDPGEGSLRHSGVSTFPSIHIDMSLEKATMPRVMEKIMEMIPP